MLKSNVARPFLLLKRLVTGDLEKAETQRRGHWRRVWQVPGKKVWVTDHSMQYEEGQGDLFVHPGASHREAEKNPGQMGLFGEHASVGKPSRKPFFLYRKPAAPKRQQTAGEQAQGGFFDSPLFAYAKKQQEAEQPKGATDTGEGWGNRWKQYGDAMQQQKKQEAPKDDKAYLETVKEKQAAQVAGKQEEETPRKEPKIKFGPQIDAFGSQREKKEAKQEEQPPSMPSLKVTLPVSEQKAKENAAIDAKMKALKEQQAKKESDQLKKQAEEAAAKKEQQAISERLKQQKEREAQHEFEGVYQKLMSAKREDIPKLAEGVSLDHAQKVIDRLNAIPGDNLTVRAAMEAKVKPAAEEKKPLVLERAKRPDGRWEPREGDDVHQVVAGPFGMPAAIHGKVIKRGDGLRVQVTGSDAMIGSAPVGKTYPVSDHWTVHGDPEIARRSEEKRQQEAAKAEQEKQQKEQAQQRSIASRDTALSGGHETVSVDNVEPGDVVHSHAFQPWSPAEQSPTKMVVTHVDKEKGEVYARGADEPETRSGGFLGKDLSLYTKEKTPAAPSTPEGPMTREYVKGVLASQYHNQGKDPERLADTWITSERFHKMTIPVDAVGTATPATGKSRSTGPIIVDANKQEVGRHEGQFGAPPMALVLDGKHRLQEARERGDKTIEAMVGEAVKPHMEKALADHTKRQAAIREATRAYTESPNGTTLRALQAVASPEEVERVRQSVRATPATPAKEEQPKDLKIGDEQRIMGDDFVLAHTATVDGVRYDLFSGKKLGDKRGALRVLDTDSGRVFAVKQHPSYDDAAREHTEALRKLGIETPPSARPKGEAPAPATPSHDPALAEAARGVLKGGNLKPDHRGAIRQALGAHSVSMGDRSLASAYLAHVGQSGAHAPTEEKKPLVLEKKEAAPAVEAEVKKERPVGSEFYDMRPRFGVAGGPDVPVLSERGRETAFAVANRKRLTHKEIETLESTYGYGDKGMVYQTEHSNLSMAKYIEVTPESQGKAVVTEAGKQAIQNFHEEQERLLERIKRTHGKQEAPAEEKKPLILEKKDQEYRYGLTYRPPGPGATPKGAVKYEKEHPSFRHGVLTYDRPLTEDEVEHHELTPFLDTEEQKQGAVKKILDDMGTHQADYAKPENEKHLREKFNRLMPKLGHADAGEMYERVKRALPQPEQPAARMTAAQEMDQAVQDRIATVKQARATAGTLPTDMTDNARLIHKKAKEMGLGGEEAVAHAGAIASMEGRDRIDGHHIAEAIQYEQAGHFAAPEGAPAEKPIRGEDPEEEEIRQRVGLNKEKIRAYDPEKAVQKIGKRWSYKTYEGNDHPSLFDTRKEALAAAERHKSVKEDQYRHPTGYYSTESLRAELRLKRIAHYQSLGFSEMEAGRRAQQEEEDLLKQPQQAEKPTPQAEKPRDAMPLSKILSSVNKEPPGGWSEADKVQKKPLVLEKKETPAASGGSYSFNEHTAFMKRLNAGEVTAEELKAQYQKARAGAGALKAELSAKPIKELVTGGKPPSGMKKGEIVDRIVERALGRYHVRDEGVSWNAFSEKYEDALERHISKTTDEDIKQHAVDYAKAVEERKQRIEGLKQAIDNPQTHEDFQHFIRVKGEGALTPEQKVKWDELQAEHTRGEREAQELRQKGTVSQVANLGDVKMNIVEHFHTKRGHSVHIVQMDQRVDRGTYDDLNKKARMLGGNYAMSFRGSPAGFQFNTREAAEKFMSLREGSVDRSGELQERKEQKQESAADHIRTVAQSLEARAQEVLGQDRKTNTARRADMAAGVEGRARGHIAFAKTMHRVADAIDRGEAKHLSGIRAMTHLETLHSLARDAQYRANQANKKPYHEWEHEEPNVHHVDHAQYPHPYIGVSDIMHAVKVAKEKNVGGTTLVGQRLLKYAAAHRKEGDDWVSIKDPRAIDDLKDFTDKLKYHGDREIRRYGEEFHGRMERYNRLQAMNIKTEPELRSALREYLSLKEAPEQEDQVKKMRRELIGRKIPGFFPTPPGVVGRMLEKADIQPGHEVLEPSAGIGDIANAVRDSHPEANVSAIELNGSLRPLLEAQGHSVVDHDFLQHEGQYDRIVMNPPFENGQDMDHVRHAYNRLKPGGKLVAVMSEGPFFRDDRKHMDFRNWLESVGGEHERLPEGSFAGADAFRQTGVNTRLVTISKPHGATDQPAGMDRSQQYHQIVKLSADDPSKLRSIDLDRVLDEAEDQGVHDGFAQWLHKQDLRPETKARLQSYHPEVKKSHRPLILGRRAA